MSLVAATEAVLRKVEYLSGRPVHVTGYQSLRMLAQAQIARADDRDRVVANLRDAIKWMQTAIIWFGEYNRLMPYHGLDLARNPSVTLLETMREGWTRMLDDERAITEKMAAYRLHDFKAIEPITWSHPDFDRSEGVKVES